MHEHKVKTKVEASFMKYSSTRTQSLMASSILALAALTAPTLATAQEITLVSHDGAINITGDLIEFADGSYVIESAFGPIRVAADQVTCIGDGCPGVDLGPVVWDVSLWGSRRAFTEHLEKLAELVDERTEGDFTLNLSYGGLAPVRENLEGIAAGDFEMAQFCAGYHPEKNPTINVLELPFLGVTTIDQEIAVSNAVFDHPSTVADMARWNATILMPTPQPQANIIGGGFPPISLASFDNMQIRAVGGVGRAVEALGATAVNLPAPAVAGAMADGTISAAAFAPHAHMAFGTLEVSTWWTTNLNPGTTNCPVVVNTAALERLSPENRIALLSSVDEALDHYVDNYEGVTMEAWGPALLERQIVEITINDEIKSAIRNEVAAPAAAEWIAVNTAAGLPAQEIYDMVQGVIASTN
jgi:TRAP-type C4-dicarboxylate transport system substrate-binding protein